MTKYRPIWPILWLCLVQQAAAAAAGVTPVSVRPLNEIVIYPRSEAPATVISLNDSRISSEVTARVVDISVRVGDVVAAGAPLVLLEKTDYELALKRAQATLESLQSRQRLAKTQLSRVQSLARSKSASRELLNQRESEVESVSAEIVAQRVSIDIARKNLERCEIRAPFKSLVLERIGQLGELATPGKALVRVLELERLEVEASIRPRDVSALLAADKLEFVSQGEHYPVTIRTLIPAQNERDRSRTLRLQFSGRSALPYSAGLLNWTSKSAHIPAEYLVKRDEQLGIFVVRDEAAEFIPLPQARQGQPAPIELPADSQIVISGRFALQQGNTVSIE